MSRPRSLLASAVVLLTIHLATSGVAGGQGGGAKAPVKPVPSTPKSVAAGASLFRAHCRGCHGNDAKGNGPEAPPGAKPADLTDGTWGHGSTDAEILEVSSVIDAILDVRSGQVPEFIVNKAVVDSPKFRQKLAQYRSKWGA